MSAPDKIIELIDRFERNIDAYKKGKYNETQVRREFIDPFFKALGWDVDNERGYAEAYKEVVHEDAIKVGWGTKAPDYSFRIGGTRKFFIEAKKPSVDIKGDIHPAFQLRRYAWSAKLPLSILTDFEEFAVYDTRIKPNKNDKASNARVMYLTFRDYPEKWEEIASIFSRDSILKGSFDKYVESGRKKRGTAEVDDAFLSEIESWRDLLARNIALRNPQLENRVLNDVVQKTIDRILFLRICEDRGVENYGQLMALINGTNIYLRLSKLFLKADERYNSGLFHFTSEKNRQDPDEISLQLSIDDKHLKDIIKRLYYPESPYEFSVLPADILGQVYERFLGKVIRLTPGHRAVVEEKPEVRKAGGVYYTPTYIVDYIVKNSVGKLLEGKTPKQAEKLKILDPACGSGSFLLGAYQYLMDWYLKEYTAENPEKYLKSRSPKIYQIRSGDWRLSTTEKKRILLNNIYGVDIDTQAVEVTKLSLLLKVLEGETDETLKSQLKLFHERALPDLGNNIKCGNSLIGSDFYEGRQLSILTEDEIYRINAFDWEKEFPDIFTPAFCGAKDAEKGFDAVIGNPPYLGRSTKFSNEEKLYINANFSTSEGKYEIFHLFIEHCTKLLRNKGYLSFVTPQTWLSIRQATKLRQILLTNFDLLKIVSIKRRVFNVSVDNIVFVLRNTNNSPRIRIYEVNDVFRFHQNVKKPTNILSNKDIFRSKGFEIDIYYNELNRNLINKIIKVSQELGSVCYAKDGVKVVGPAKDFAFCKEKIDETFFPMIIGKDIGRYYLQWGGLYCCRDKRKIEKQKVLDIRLREEFIFKRPKIVVRKTGNRIIAVADDYSYYYEQSLFSISKKVLEYGIELLFVLGILNSKIANYLLKADPFSKKYTFPQIRLHWLKKFPIRKIEFSNPSEKSQHDKIVLLVEQMLDLNKRISASQTQHEKTILHRQIDATDRQIDQLVYKLYELTEEEIGIIEVSI